jgi:hypothetical protein
MLTVVHILLEDPVIHNNAQTGFSIIVLRAPHVLGWLKGKTYLTPAFSWPLNFCVFHEIYLNLDLSKRTELSAMTQSTAASMLPSQMAKTLIALSCIKKISTHAQTCPFAFRSHTAMIRKKSPKTFNSMLLLLLTTCHICCSVVSMKRQPCRELH